MPDNEVGAIALVYRFLIATTRNGQVLGFNAATGELVWEYHPDGNPDVPLVDGMSVCLPVHTPSERYLIALDHTSGEAVARFQVDQNILPHTVRKGVLFASTIDIRGDRVEPGRSIYAVDVRTGDVLWAFEPGVPWVRLSTLTVGGCIPGPRMGASLPWMRKSGRCGGRVSSRASPSFIHPPAVAKSMLCPAMVSCMPSMRQMGGSFGNMRPSTPSLHLRWLPTA